MTKTVKIGGPMFRDNQTEKMSNILKDLVGKRIDAIDVIREAQFDKINAERELFNKIIEAERFDLLTINYAALNKL